MGNPFINSADGGPCIACKHCEGFKTDHRGARALCRVVAAQEWWKYMTGCRYWQEVEPVRESEQSAHSSPGSTSGSVR